MVTSASPPLPSDTVTLPLPTASSYAFWMFAMTFLRRSALRLLLVGAPFTSSLST